MECIKEEGRRFCKECTCDTKKCFRCEIVKDLKEFNETKKPHVMRIKANKERVYLCKECAPLQVQELIERYGERR